jgi:hypothetical protein
MAHVVIAAALAVFHLGMAWADGLYAMSVNKDEAIRWLDTAAGKCLHMHCLAQEAKRKAHQKLNVLKAS